MKRRVTRTFVVPSAPLVAVSVVRAVGTLETIHSTYDHPYWTRHRGWIGAAALSSGEELLSSHETPLYVAHVSFEGRPAPVYNLEVEGTHTYFVGDASALVHNICEAPGAQSPLVNDMKNGQGKVIMDNCPYCTAAALSNQSASSLLGRANFPYVKGGLTDAPISRLFKAAGLSRGERKVYDGTKAGFLEATKTIEKGQAVGFSYMRKVPKKKAPSGHILTAIRKKDGKLYFVDFQPDPPEVSTMLKRGQLNEITVFPVTRQPSKAVPSADDSPMFNWAFQHGKHVKSIEPGPGKALLTEEN